MKRYLLLAVAMMMMASVQAQEPIRDIVRIGYNRPMSPKEIAKQEKEEARRYRKDSIRYVQRIKAELRPAEDSIMREIRKGTDPAESGLMWYLSRNQWTVVTDEFVGKVARKVRKSARKIAGIAQCYYSYREDETGYRLFYVEDTVRAFNYIRQAIATDAACERAYVLAADMLAYSGEHQQALEWLRHGQELMPADTALLHAEVAVLFGMERAEVSNLRQQGWDDVGFIDLYEPAVNRMRKFKEKNPSYPLDLELARFYYQLYDKGGVLPWEPMAESYGRADRKDFKLGDFQAYALALAQSKQFGAGVELTEDALKQYKDDPMLNEQHFYCTLWSAHEEKDREKNHPLFEEAVAAADSFFAIANKERLMPIHYLRYGEALCGARQYTKALMVYEQLLKKPAMEWRDSLACLGHITTVMVEQANEYIREGRHAAAAKRPSNMPRRCWR